jgi:hypothetical protein
MMFTTLSAKRAGMKAKLTAGAAVAAVALLMAAPAAQAQRVRFGVTIGAPVYVAPAPEVVFAGPGYYDGFYYRDYNTWRAHYTQRDQRFDRDNDRNVDRDRNFDRGRDQRFGRR